jgi:hypothetical protein
MVESDDECVARSCIRTRFSNQMLLLAVQRHFREPIVTMMPLIAAPPLTHSTDISLG